MSADLDEEKDERLAALAAGGDRDAFDALVTRHRQAVYRLCWSATGNAADADDAAQETFVRVHRSLPSYDPARPFGPWLRKIAWNCGLSVRRDGNAGVPRVAEGDAPEAADPAPGPEEAAAGNEERRKVAGEPARRVEQQVTGKAKSASGMRIAKEPSPGSPCELTRTLAERERFREAEVAQRACLAGDLDAPSREKGLVFLAELLDRQARFAEADAVIEEVDRQFPQSRPLDLYRQRRPMVQKRQE